LNPCQVAVPGRGFYFLLLLIFIGQGTNLKNARATPWPSGRVKYDSGPKGQPSTAQVGASAARVGLGYAVPETIQAL